MTHRRSSFVVALLAAFACSTAAAQPTRPMGQTLLKRIAEAVDGDRTGRPLWVVASYDSPNLVAGVTRDSLSAMALARQSGSSYRWFGPYVSDFAIPLPPPMPGCVHDGRASIMAGLSRRNADSVGGIQPAGAPADSSFGGICPDLRRRDMPVRMSLVLEYPTGTPRTIPIEPSVDAIFLGIPAIDKFVVPYYVKTLGLARATELRRQLIGNVP